MAYLIEPEPVAIAKDLDTLYLSLQERRRPEDIADIVLRVLGNALHDDEVALLQKAAQGALRHHLLNYTSMAQEFARPVGAQKQVAKAEELFVTASSLTPEECLDPEAVVAFIGSVGQGIRKSLGSNDFREDRLNRATRKNAGLDLSKRRYNKLFRHLVRLERKMHTLAQEWKKRECMMIGKSGFASQLSRDAFLKDTNSACFIAYYTARMNLRSEFTIGGQQRPFDEIAAMLLERCHTSDANYLAIAHVRPTPEILSHLSDDDKGMLLGQWFGTLQEVAGLLRSTWNRSDINRQTMIVRRGNDSSTWNGMAGAWNRARDSWINLIYALGMEAILDTLCPGKVLRLMAADVAYWHRATGGGLDPNTLVWQEIPLPWEVLFGEATCTRATIQEACEKHGIVAEETGWIAPRPATEVAPFRPTPELVHGVTVSNPFLATFLRRAGFFSGKPITIASV